MRSPTAIRFSASLAAAGADVDEELVEFRHLRFFAPVLHVDGERADDAEHLAVAAVDVDALAPRQAGIVPAHAAEPDEAVVVDVLDLEGDLVGVALHHDFRRALGVEDRHGVAVGVGLDFVGVGLQVVEPDALAPRLLARRGGRIEEGGEKFEGFGAHGSHRINTIGGPGRMEFPRPRAAG